MTAARTITATGPLTMTTNGATTRNRRPAKPIRKLPTAAIARVQLAADFLLKGAPVEEYPGNNPYAYEQRTFPVHADGGVGFQFDMITDSNARGNFNETAEWHGIVYRRHSKHIFRGTTKNRVKVFGQIWVIVMPSRNNDWAFATTEYVVFLDNCRLLSLRHAKIFTYYPRVAANYKPHALDGYIHNPFVPVVLVSRSYFHVNHDEEIHSYSGSWNDYEEEEDDDDATIDNRNLDSEDSPYEEEEEEEEEDNNPRPPSVPPTPEPDAPEPRPEDDPSTPPKQESVPETPPQSSVIVLLVDSDDNVEEEGTSPKTAIVIEDDSEEEPSPQKPRARVMSPAEKYEKQVRQLQTDDEEEELLRSVLRGKKKKVSPTVCINSAFQHLWKET